MSSRRLGHSRGRYRRGEFLHAADVFAYMVRDPLATIDMVGTGAMPFQAAALVALQGHLVRLSPTAHLPEHQAAFGFRLRLAERQVVFVERFQPLARRARQ